MMSLETSPDLCSINVFSSLISGFDHLMTSEGAKSRVVCRVNKHLSHVQLLGTMREIFLLEIVPSCLSRLSVTQDIYFQVFFYFTFGSKARRDSD